MVSVVSEMLELGVERVIVVNDGSSEECRPIFDRTVALSPRVTLLEHAINCGKGHALKTAFNHILLSNSGCDVVVTLDADGQHLPRNALEVASRVDPERPAMHIGVRTFQASSSFADKIPLRSKLGNVVTRFVVNALFDIPLLDTQSGLRAFPVALLPSFLSIRSYSYDFEMDMLLLCQKKAIPIEQHPIETIYEEGNPTSHFNPLVDSLKIYYVFIRYLGVAIASFLLEYVVFFLAMVTFAPVAWITHLIVRLFTSGVNFLWNRKFVFQSEGDLFGEYKKYLVTMFYVLLTSTALLFLGTERLGMNAYYAKPCADFITFIISFTLQRSWVFRRSED